MSQALETPGSGVPGTWRRVPAVLPAEVPKYPIPPPYSYPKHPVSFLMHQRTLSPIDFWCALGVNLSLSTPRAGFGGPNSLTKGYCLSLYATPAILFYPFLALPKGLNRKWAQAGVGTSRPLLP